MKHYKPAILFYSLVFLFPDPVLAQNPVPSIYKNTDYRNAVQWLKKNNYIYDSLKSYHVPPDEAIAIVFPELMRYSALEDQIEVTGLMVLYTRLGKDYADFSVGRFQMKPSFIQQLETDARKYLSKKEIQLTCPFLLGGKDSENIRRKRVNSLVSVKNEVCYLALFYKVCLKRFKNIHFKNATDRLRFLATAYNCGYHHTMKNLYVQMKKEQFPVYNSIVIRHVNYAELSLKWWESNSHHKTAYSFPQ